MKSTYFYFIQIYPTVIHHPNKMVSIQFIKKNINSYTACRCTKNISKDVNICKHIHHHSNNLEQEIQNILLKENIMHCMTLYQNKFYKSLSQVKTDLVSIWHKISIMHLAPLGKLKQETCIVCS